MTSKAKKSVVDREGHRPCRGGHKGRPYDGHASNKAGQATLPSVQLGIRCYPALRFRATGCGMRMSAPVTRLTSVIESYGKLMAACAFRMDSSSGPDMKQ